MTQPNEITRFMIVSAIELLLKPLSDTLNVFSLFMSSIWATLIMLSTTTFCCLSYFYLFAMRSEQNILTRFNEYKEVYYKCSRLLLHAIVIFLHKDNDPLTCHNHWRFYQHF